MNNACVVFLFLLNMLLVRSTHAAASSTTPLHDAAQALYVDLCKQLINSGVDVNAQDANGNTPLHLLLAQLKPLKNNALDALVSKIGQETLTKIDAIQSILEIWPHAQNKTNKVGMSVQQTLTDALLDKTAKGWAVADPLPGVLAKVLRLPVPKSPATGPATPPSTGGGVVGGATEAERMENIANIIYQGASFESYLSGVGHVYKFDGFDGTELFSPLGKMGRRGRAEPTQGQKDFNKKFGGNNPKLLHYVAFMSKEEPFKKHFTEIFNHLKNNDALNAVDSAGNSVWFYVNESEAKDKAAKLAFLATKFPGHVYPESKKVGLVPPSGGTGSGGTGKPKSGTKAPLKQLKKSLKALKAKLATLAGELANL
ncbi:ankyrin repeat domain-containing protein [Candidatus Babeliales bacterium]|nr:ankyrin repeat domain-containing protein [Candidatus Babeliales bacterium]